jgi:hypothetical protein
MNMKKMKIVSGLMAMTMTAMSLGISAFAADNVNVSIGKDTKAAGETFSVDVDLSALPSSGLTSVDFAIDYDASVIAISDVTAGTADNGAAAQEGDLGDTVFSWKDTGKQIVLIWSTGLTDSKYWLKEGKFVTITGTVNKDAKSGDSSPLTGVAVSREAYPGGAANSEIVFSAVGETATTDYTAVFTNGSVTVGGGTTSEKDWGDANCSGEADVAKKVTVADAVMLARTAAEDASGITDTGKINGDVNNSGAIDPQDTVILLQYLAGLVKYGASAPASN